MKAHTRQTMNTLTELGERLGFKKKRRGLLFVPGHETGLYNFVSFLPREWPDGSLQIDVYAHVVWDALEEMSARGFGLKYRFGDSYSHSVFLSVTEPFEFHPERAAQSEVDRISCFLEEILPPTFENTSSKLFIKNEINYEIQAGSGYPEKAVIIRELESGEKTAEYLFNLFLDSDLSDFHKERLRKFWEKHVLSGMPVKTSS